MNNTYETLDVPEEELQTIVIENKSKWREILEKDEVIAIFIGAGLGLFMSAILRGCL